MRDLQYFEKLSDKLLEENEKLKEDFKTIVEILLRVSPSHRGWLENNFPNIMEEIDKELEK